MQTIRKSFISNMPYRVRLDRYRREKDELFEQMAYMTTAEIEEAQKELVRKWQI